MKLNMLLNLPLGANTAPIGLIRKCDVMDGLGAVGALIGGAFNLWATDDTNYTNLVLNDRTNRSNEEINRQQLAWAREQYEQEKAENRFLVDQAYERELENREHNEEYNTPAAMMARYRAAGINPYLAMFGSGSSGAAGVRSSVNASVGSNPHANQPSMIPMQNPAPMQIPQGFGSSLVDAIDNMAKNDIARGALNEQIEARVANMELEYMKFLEEKANNKSQRDFYKAQIEDMSKKFALETSKFEKEKDWQNFQKYYQQAQLEQHDKELEIQNYLANSKIKLDSAQVSEIATAVIKMKQEVFEMQRSGDSKQAIDKWIERQQELTFKNMELDWKRRDPNGYSKFGQQWNDFSSWLTGPIKGLVSLGIKP